MLKLNKKYFLIFYILAFIAFINWTSCYNKINILIDNKNYEYWTTAETVGEVFQELDNFNLDSNDIIKPNLTTNIVNGFTVDIIRVKKQKVSLKKEIPYEIKYKNDPNIIYGQKKVINKGQNGVLSQKYLITYHNESEQNRELIEESVLKEPINEIIALGIKRTVQRAGKILDYTRTLSLKATAYTKTGNRTATGVWPKRGTVAVDPRIIPLGTKLYVDGYGYAVAEDIGSAIKGQRIDLFMETKNEALKWGSRMVRVYILK